MAMPVGCHDAICPMMNCNFIKWQVAIHKIANFIFHC